MILLVSDLHLEPQRPDLVRAFLHLLETRARGAEALYILGDLFEAWIGSPHHLENMLGNYGGLGVAVAYDAAAKNRPYWAMVLCR